VQDPVVLNAFAPPKTKQSLFESLDAVGVSGVALSTATDVPWTLRRRPELIAEDLSALLRRLYKPQDFQASITSLSSVFRQHMRTKSSITIINSTSQQSDHIMASTSNILVTAAGGNIGSLLVPMLANHNVKLTLATRNAARLQAKLAPAANISIEEGSIKDPQWVETILEKQIDTVFLCLTSHDELIVALNFLDAVKRAGTVKHLVYVSACGDFATGAGLEHLMKTQSAMHVVVKATIEQKLKYGGFPWTSTVLGPTLFFTNDLRSKDSMLAESFFDEPLGKAGASRVSVPDIALAARETLLNPAKWAGKKIMIGSLQRFTGTESAALWSKALGRQIKIEESTEHYEAAYPQWKREYFGLDAEMSKAWERDLKLMYEAFGEHGFGMSEEEYKLQVEVLGKDPDDYAQWVHENGSQWV
jgi:uncharacterized protein YbjT (DUF2867 family)